MINRQKALADLDVLIRELREFDRKRRPDERPKTNLKVREEGKRIALALSALYKELSEDVKKQLVTLDAAGAKVPLTFDNLIGGPGSNQTAIDFLKRFRRDLQKIDF
jgi:hypothetical protein